jgi:uncharacterized protein YjdB
MTRINQLILGDGDALSQVITPQNKGKNAADGLLTALL